MAGVDRISVTVCFAEADHQEVIPLTVTSRTTVQQAIEQSGIMLRCPNASMSKENIGIYGKRVKLDQCLQDHDRIEILPALVQEPGRGTPRARQTGKIGILRSMDCYLPVCPG